MIRIVDLGINEENQNVVQIQAEGLTEYSNINSITANGYEVGILTTGKTLEAVELVKADIQLRIDAGEVQPVLQSHLEALGLVEAVENWVRNS